MSQITAAFFIVVALSSVAMLAGPMEPGRCCNDPGHSTPIKGGEIMYCPARGY